MQKTAYTKVFTDLKNYLVVAIINYEAVGYIVSYELQRQTGFFIEGVINISMYDIVVTREQYENIQISIGALPPETGGILGEKGGVVSCFYFDHHAKSLTDCYSPNIKDLNFVISDWKSKGISFCGLIHSHPSGVRRLSYKDRKFAEDILKASGGKLTDLLFPIVQSTYDSEHFEIVPYVIKQQEVIPATLQIIL
jgi:hypothetical protein